jgi:hypothetical protein
MIIFFENSKNEKIICTWDNYQGAVPNIGDHVMLNLISYKEEFKVIKRIFTEEYVTLVVMSTDGYI